MNVKHTQDDIGSDGCLGLQYIYDGRAYVSQIDPDHAWFTGAAYQTLDPNADYEILGWFPGRGSPNLLQEFADALIPQDGENLIPSEQKRKIRIIDTEISKG